MPTIIGEKQLKEYIQEGKIIQDGDVSSAEGIKYDFHLGNRFLKAGFNSEKTYEELNARDQAIVEPGEVVFVMTAERLEIPNNVNVQLNFKRKVGHEGISLLGGTSIDPGYRGYLVFGIHNVAGGNFKLKPGRKIVGATFYHLSEEEAIDDSSSKPDPIENFPDDLVDLIENYKPVNPQVINSRLNDLQMRLDKDRDALLQKLDVVDNRIDSLGTDVNIKLGNLEKNFGEQLSNSNTLLSDKIQTLDNRITNISEDMNSIKTSILTAKVWVKVLTWIAGIIGATLAGIATGFFENIINFFTK